MSKKICFFDIDGTLWDAKGTIPVSTISAIRQLHKNGHLAFINTGRTRAFVHSEDLLGIGFDGIVAGIWADDQEDQYKCECRGKRRNGNH